MRATTLPACLIIRKKSKVFTYKVFAFQILYYSIWPAALEQIFILAPSGKILLHQFLRSKLQGLSNHQRKKYLTGKKAGQVQRKTQKDLQKAHNQMNDDSVFLHGTSCVELNSTAINFNLNNKHRPHDGARGKSWHLTKVIWIT